MEGPRTMGSMSASRGLLTCEFCGRTFNRHEHLRRHSRTHTKEKPYVCSCSRSFSRKDLLTRHERLSHSSNGNRGRTQGSTSNPPRSADRSQTGLLEALPRHRQQDLDHADLSLQSVPPTAEFRIADPMPLSPIDGLFASHGDPMLDFNRFLSSAELNMDWDAYLADSVPVPEGIQFQNATGQHFTPDSTDFSSRIPDDISGDDDFRELKPLSCPWLISELQRLQFNEALAPFQHVIPQFALPTRASIARYMSGYVDGFTDHHPFIHAPTLRILSYHRSPETFLALLSIGAQYRYETKTARALYKVSRSIILERLGKGELYPRTGDINHSQHESTSDTALSDNMDRTRALLLLATYCLWQNQASLTQESFEYQGLIARSIRQNGLLETLTESGDEWSQWVKLETDRRTVFFGWCLLNLQSFAYDSSPLLIGRELNQLPLPCSCQEWVARNESEWLAARAQTASKVTFKEAHSSHLATSNDTDPVSDISPTGTYILIHALLQRIYLSQQLSRDVDGLPSQDADDLEQALSCWRHTWRTSPESVLGLQSTYASLAFTSTALLGAVHIRLHCNLGQWRNLQSGDPAIVAMSLQRAPVPRRGPHLIYALLHSVRALNIPVQLGISYLPQCSSFSWSIHHALCDLECAVFLGKWLHSISETWQQQPLSELENRVLRWIMRVIREALLSQDETIDLGYKIEGTDFSDLTSTAQQLSYMVVKVWAQMFKSCNSPWPVVLFIGQSLDHYAEINNPDLANESTATNIST